MKFNDEMKLKAKLYIFISFVVILFYFTILRIDAVKIWLGDMVQLLFPFIFGFVVAFLLNKPMMLLESLLEKIHFPKKLRRSIAAICSLILGILIVFIFFAMIGPQIVDSLASLVEQAPSLWKMFILHLNEFLEKYNINAEFINNLVSTDFIGNFLEKITSTLTQTIPTVFAFGGKVTSVLLDILIGLIAGLYLMFEKEMFIKGLKRFTYAFFKKDIADYLVRFSNITAKVFNDFILGKALDSLIIGILTYLAMNIFKMPYALLLSTIVGITNMIPVFGPFIGAIPGVFILMIMDFKLGLYFALLILAIQQLDGNIIGPIILGDRLGLPSLAILFSVSVGGGLFGIVGMFIGVPITAVIYIAVKEIVDERLEKKKIEL
ncbi:MAG: AI-2E family transporter [Traorella sp.]